jgi:SEC-C motif
MAPGAGFHNALELLATSPPERYGLLEFGLEWDGLVGVDAQLAAALRLFVITRDPLDWLSDRGSAWATVNGDGDTLELCAYISRGEVNHLLEANGGDLAAAIGPLGASVVVAASQCQGIAFAGAYPELAFRGEAPRLLEPSIDAGRLGPPVLTVRSLGWEPIGLGAIQDLVQDAFGPVDFDRSTVTLRPVDPPERGCPACAGYRFGFPGDLADALDAMCETHRAQAQAQTDSRIARAYASNAAGWRAIGKGSARVNDLPDPPGGAIPQRRASAPGRNDPCPCGSGRKYKQCCAR